MLVLPGSNWQSFPAAAQFRHFQNNHVFIDRQHPAVHPARFAIQESEPPKVHVEKAQGWPERQPKRQFLERAAARDGIASKQIAPAEPLAFERFKTLFCFVPRIAIMLLEPRMKSFVERVMFEMA